MDDLALNLPRKWQIRHAASGVEEKSCPHQPAILAAVDASVRILPAFGGNILNAEEFTSVCGRPPIISEENNL